MVKSGLVSKYKAVWAYLAGDPLSSPLEHRIYNSFCILALIAIAYEIPFNFIIGLPVSGWISVVLFVIQFYLYYLSRFRKKVNISLLASGGLIHVLFAVNYYYNSGIDGPSLLFFALTFYVIISAAPRKQYPLWFLLNLLVVTGLLLSEFFIPQLVTDSYATRGSHFTDMVSGYVVLIALIFFGTTYMRSNYMKEKISAEEKAAELEQLNSEKSKILSIISHDFRSPLASVMSYLEFLNEVDLDAAEKQKFEADLLNVTRNTNELLTNLLAWSKSQMDGMSVRLESINVKQALTQTLEVLKAAAAKKNIALNYNIHPSLDITADRDMLQLITRNLVSNSIKFSSFGGEINVDCILAEDNCVLVVQDKGEGIPVEEQKKIFTAKTAPRYGTREEKGVGLGLVLCKEFTELQHGKIWFESRPGEGSAFYVSLPLFKKPAPAEPGGPFSSCPPELSLLKL